MSYKVIYRYITQLDGDNKQVEKQVRQLEQLAQITDRLGQNAISLKFRILI